MKHYRITLEDKSGNRKEKVVKKMTFPEAASVAYYMRNITGSDFEILSIIKI